MSLNGAISGDVDWLLSRTRIWFNTLRYWNRLVNMNANKTSKVVFEMDYHNLSPHSWSSEIKSVLTELQLLNNFENSGLVNLNSAKLNHLHSESWRKQCNRRRRL